MRNTVLTGVFVIAVVTAAAVPVLVRAVILVESGYSPGARSPREPLA